MRNRSYYNIKNIIKSNLLIILMLIGGGIGLTVGGIKLARVYLTLRIMKENIQT